MAMKGVTGKMELIVRSSCPPMKFGEVKSAFLFSPFGTPKQLTELLNFKIIECRITLLWNNNRNQINIFLKLLFAYSIKVKNFAKNIPITDSIVWMKVFFLSSPLTKQRRNKQKLLTDRKWVDCLNTYFFCLSIVRNYSRFHWLSQDR